MSNHVILVFPALAIILFSLTQPMLTLSLFGHFSCTQLTLTPFLRGQLPRFQLLLKSFPFAQQECAQLSLSTWMHAYIVLVRSLTSLSTRAWSLTKSASSHATTCPHGKQPQTGRPHATMYTNHTWSLTQVIAFARDNMTAW